MTNTIFDISVHKNILFQILKDIYSDTTIAPMLGFKGGTAALMFFELNRFSVDLDFDLLDTTKENTVQKRVNTILSAYGRVEEMATKRFTLFFLLSYQYGECHIKIEISRRPTKNTYDVLSWLGIPMLVMSRHDMFANKLAALLDRKVFAKRDLFDVWFFAKSDWPLDAQKLEDITGESTVVYLKKCIDFVEKLDGRYILQGLGELLDAKQKAWVKEHLRSEALFQLKLLGYRYAL